MAEAYGDSRNDKPKTSSSRTKSSSSSSSKSSSSSSSSRTKSSSSSGTKSSSSSSAGTAAENAAAKAKAKKVAELKKLAKTVEKTGTELEKTSNYLVEAMQDLKKGLTGASAAVINTITDTAQGVMETISNFLNSTGSKIASDLKSEGEQYAFGKSKVNVEKPTTKGNDVFSCDTDVLKGDVIPRLEKAQNTSGNASNEIAKAPKVQGYEGVSKEAEEINSVGTIIGNIINQVKDIIEKAQQTENKNDGITSALGNTVSSLLGGIVPKATAAEIEQKGSYTNDMNDASKDNSLAAQLARDNEAQAEREAEAKRKETMAKELNEEGRTRGKVPPKETEPSTYNSYDPSKDNSAAAQISRDRDAQNQNLKPKNNGQIAHRGYGAEENSIEAFRNAGEAGYWGCETDVRFDSAGNIVCSHGAVGKGEEAVSLERYLEICKEYGMTPVIDIKYEDGNDKQNKELAQKIIEITDKMGMTETTVLQTDRTSDISNIREASDSVEIWYLANKGVSSIDADVIKENNVGGINIKDSTGKNTTNAQQIKDIQDLVGEDVDICIWNVKTTSTKDQVLNKGATYVMSDNKLGVTQYKEGDTDFNLVNDRYQVTNKDGKFNLGVEEKKQEDQQEQKTTNQTSVFGGLWGVEDFHGVEDTLTSLDLMETINNNQTSNSSNQTTTEPTKVKINSIYDASMDNSLAAQMRKDMLAEMEQLEEEKEKIKSNGIYGNPASDGSILAQLSRDKVAELEREQTHLLANYYGIETEGKTNNEIIQETAKKIGLELTKTTTTTVQGKFEMPYFNQQLYPEGWVCCAACTAAQIASFGLGRVVDPYELVKTFPYLETNYRTGKGTGNDWLWKLEGWEEYNLQYYTGKVGDASNLMQSHEIDKVVQILEEGGIVGLLAKENIFTTGGHYLTFYGISEDGERLLFIDPDGDKLTPYGEKTEYGKNGRGTETYMDYLENGIPIETLKTIGNCSYYGFKKIHENYSESHTETTYTETNKTSQELLEEIMNETTGKISSNKFEKVTISDGVQTQYEGATKKDQQTNNVEIPHDILPQTGSNRTPRYNQLDYADTVYGGGNIATSGCGITCLAEYLTRTTGQPITPEMLANEFNDKGGTNAQRLEAALDAYGLNSEINNGGNKKNDILEALENGKSAIVLMNESSNFTTTGHYIILEGMTEDGKILVYDPNGANVENKSKYGDGYKNGFDVDYVMQGLGGGYVLEKNING